MKEFKGKVAVITGAASGIGYAIAERCAQEGMNVVLAGINQENLIQAEETLKTAGAVTLSVQTDVSKLGDIEALAERTLDTFGAVHLLVNNAGVAAGTTVWESTVADWQWVLGVNLWGVIYGLKVFVPLMLAQDTECHIVNTASIAGLLPHHAIAPYQVSKHAVVALSENLYHSLAQRKAQVRVSVLCPGMVKTRIVEAARNRPLELQDELSSGPMSPEHAELLEYFRQAVQAGISPRKVADHVFHAIRTEQLYILTHPELNSGIQKRMDHILQQRKPD